MATSKLQKAVGELLDKTFPEYNIKENYRPEWLLSSNLTRLELDFYIDETKTAFEIQGAQHFEYIPHFHGEYAGFELRKKYDQEKRDLCIGAKVKLLEIFTFMDALVEVNNIKGSSAQSNTDISVEYFRKPINYNYSTKKLKQSKDAQQEEILLKYLSDFKVQELVGDPDATIEQKLREVELFNKKVDKFRKRYGDKYLPYFQFHCLSLNEQKAVMEGINTPIVIDLTRDYFEGVNDDGINELKRWKKKAVKTINKSGTLDFEFSSKHLPKAFVITFSDKLKQTTNKEDVNKLFQNYGII